MNINNLPSVPTLPSQPTVVNTDSLQEIQAITNKNRKNMNREFFIESKGEEVSANIKHPKNGAQCIAPPERKSPAGHPPIKDPTASGHQFGGKKRPPMNKAICPPTEHSVARKFRPVSKLI